MAELDARGYQVKAALGLYEHENFSIDPYIAYEKITYEDSFGGEMETSGTSIGFSVSIYADYSK